MTVTDVTTFKTVTTVTFETVITGVTGVYETVTLVVTTGDPDRLSKNQRQSDTRRRGARPPVAKPANEADLLLCKKCSSVFPYAVDPPTLY